jgi:uncharacterized membrane protein YraQ (UPF0718 family)
MTTLVLILRQAATTTWQLLPYVVLGVVVSEALRYTAVAPLLDRACRKHPAVSVPLAAAVGIVSPLCTYGTVPLVLQLLRAGVPLAPLATFLSASSLMNPQLLLITWGGLGPTMAIGRVVAVFAFGLLLGGVVHMVPARLAIHTDVRDEHVHACKPRPTFSCKGFVRSCLKTLEFIGFYVLLGVLLGAAIEVLVPGRWIMTVFGAGGWYQLLLAALLGVPLYACGGGTIPLVRSLMEQGMAGGAVLAFLIAGPATRIPPLMALATIVRPFIVVGYVVFLIIYSVVAGLLYQLF